MELTIRSEFGCSGLFLFVYRKEMTSNEWQAAKHKVLSWIEHEERCVTTQRIAQGMNLSRLEASQLLQEISQEHQDSKFRFTYCQQEESTEDCIPVTGTRN